MKRPNGVIVNTQSVISGSATISVISDVPPCKVSECDYFHRNSRDPNEFREEHAVSLNHQSDNTVAGCLNGVQSIIDDLKDRLSREHGCIEDGSLTDHHKEGNDTSGERGPGNPASPLRAASVVDVDFDDDNHSCRSAQSIQVICDEDMADKEGQLNPETEIPLTEASKSIVPLTNKRVGIEQDIKGLMTELCRHEAALIILKKIRANQLIYFGSGENKLRTSPGTYGRTNLHQPNIETTINAGRFNGIVENDQNIAPRQYIARTAIEMDSRLTIDRQLGQTDRHPNHMPVSANSSWSKGVSAQGRNGTIQTTQRFNSHQQVSSRGITGCTNQMHHTMDRTIQLRTMLTENVQKTVDEFLENFRSYTELSLSSKINKPSLTDKVQPELKTMSSFLAFMPNNAVNFIPSTVNPEFTMLIGLEVICNRLENRLFISKQNCDPGQESFAEVSVESVQSDANCDASPRQATHEKLENSASKDGKQATPINRCSKCKTYSSPYFFDLTDSTMDHGISDLVTLKYPLCCGNCLRALRIEQLTNVQFRKYQDILDNHKAMEKNTEVSLKQIKPSAEKRPAERRQEEYKYKTRSPQTYHHGPSQHNDYSLESSSGIQNNQLKEKTSPSNSMDIKVRPADVNINAHSVLSNLPFPPPPHMTPEQFQQCHTEWLRQAALLQSHGGTNTGDNLLLGSHFPVGAPPLLSNAVAAAAALAAMTATHCQGAGFMASAPINSFPIMSTAATSMANSFSRHEQATLSDLLGHQSHQADETINHSFDDDCGVALNLTTRSDKHL